MKLLNYTFVFLFAFMLSVSVKAQDIYTKLFSGQKVHASPAMHQATPMEDLVTITKKLEYMFETEGVTHLDRYGALWSGNLQGWIQYRQLLANHYKRG